MHKAGGGLKTHEPLSAVGAMSAAASSSGSSSGGGSGGGSAAGSAINAATGGAFNEAAPVAPVPSAVGPVIRGRLPPSEFPVGTISVCTKLGKRKKQEDRCIVVPRVSGQDDVCFLGVFDGTVGDNAAEFVHTAIQDALLTSRPFAESCAAARASPQGFLNPQAVQKMEAALLEGYRACDEQLIKMCAEANPPIDYSSCTSVTAVVSGEVLSVAHLGDSKVVLGREVGGVVQGKGLTTDHKPDMPEERRRIEKAGGSLAYLHGGKPFIRGGDFTERQLKGDRPMQLNYSRAFGGKDLKMYGLSAVPDVLQMQLTAADRLVILASDGLWDVAMADVAAKRAWDSVRAGRDPSLDLTDWALQQHELKGSVDNVTCIVIVLRPPGPAATS